MTIKTHTKHIDNICKCCNFYTRSVKDYNRHILTPKHQRMTNNYETYPTTIVNKSHCCGCGKKYKYRQGLHAHQKNCSSSTIKPNDEINTNDIDNESIVLTLIAKNKGLMELLSSQQQQQQQQQRHNAEEIKCLVETIQKQSAMTQQIIKDIIHNST